MAALNLLTDTQVKKAKEGYTSDGGNLYVRRRGSGINFVFRFKVRLTARWADLTAKGKPVEIGLGSYPARSLKDARELAARLRAEIEADRNPALLLKPEAEPVAKTFSDYAAELIETKKAGWRNGKHHAQWPATLSAYAYPVIGSKQPGAITVSDVQAILTPLWATKTETATRVRQRVEAVIDYALLLRGSTVATRPGGRASWTRLFRLPGRWLARSSTTPPRLGLTCPASWPRVGSVCLNRLAGWISKSPLVGHAAARSGWSKYTWSGVRPPSAECGLTAW